MNIHNLILPLALATAALAQSVVLPPPGVAPGESYRLLVVTNGTRAATSTIIANYDTWVQAQIAAVPELAAIPTTWRALAGTPGNPARVHSETTWTATEPGLPIYRPDGAKIADSYQHFWSAGAGMPLHNTPWSPLNGTAPAVNQVWTGAKADGSNATALGNINGNPTFGTPESTDGNWMQAGNAFQFQAWRMYAISDVLTHHNVQYPEGLEPGDQFRVMFVTDGTTPATNGTFAYYDALVTAEAQAAPELAALNTTWTAVVSTPEGNARVHTGTTHNSTNHGPPIYRPDGKRIAHSHRHLWRVVTEGALVNPVDLTPTLQVTTAIRVWTGTSGNGGPDNFDVLGDPSGTSATGQPSAQSYAWVNAGYNQQTGSRPIYGVSAVLTVPLAATETMRPGMPANPSAFLPGQTSGPIAGQVWDPIVDHTTFATNPALDFAFFGNLSANVAVPGFGLVLVDQVIGSVSVTPGSTFAVSCIERNGSGVTA